jgi:hypothetical protein
MMVLGIYLYNFIDIYGFIALDMAMYFDHIGYPQAIRLLQKCKVQLLWFVSLYISVVCVSYLIIKIKHFDECPEVIPGLFSPYLSVFPSPRFN